MPDPADLPNPKKEAAPRKLSLGLKVELHFAVPFLAGALALGSATYVVDRSAAERLSADLAAARSTNAAIGVDNTALRADNDTLRKSMDSAVANSDKLAGSVRQMAGQLADEHQRSVAQQSRLDEQQRIIDGIAIDVAKSGDDVGRELRALADGFIKLYSYYHPAGKNP